MIYIYLTAGFAPISLCTRAVTPFDGAVDGVAVRAFVVEWALRSFDEALALGAEAASCFFLEKLRN